MDISAAAARERAALSLQGLSIGDAFGERFFYDPLVMIPRLQQELLPEAPWRWSDDSAQAQALVHWLMEHPAGQDQDSFAACLAQYYVRDRSRGYGSGAHRLLEGISQGQPWRTLVRDLFMGQGSYGNGAAMRMAPLGAYFAEDLDEVVAQATLNAQVTHAHPEGIAGGVAIAVAAASLWQTRELGAQQARQALWEQVLTRTPKDADHELTWLNLERASRLPLDASVELAVQRLGNGSQISAQDTVGLCLWMMARHVDDLERALWSTVGALGDRDTTCAIVSGALIMRAGQDALPQTWWSAREPLWLDALAT